jgi:hypothetical protein
MFSVAVCLLSAARVDEKPVRAMAAAVMRSLVSVIAVKLRSAFVPFA